MGVEIPSEAFEQEDEEGSSGGYELLCLLKSWRCVHYACCATERMKADAYASSTNNVGICRIMVFRKLEAMKPWIKSV